VTTCLIGGAHTERIASFDDYQNCVSAGQTRYDNPKRFLPLRFGIFACTLRFGLDQPRLFTACRSADKKPGGWTAERFKSEIVDTISLARDFSVTTQSVSPQIDRAPLLMTFFAGARPKRPLKFLGQRVATIRHSFRRAMPDQATLLLSQCGHKAPINNFKRRFEKEWVLKMTRPSDITRTRILKAAERLFADRGYEETSIRAIVAKARVNQAAINYHPPAVIMLDDAAGHWIGPVRRQMRPYQAELGGTPSPDTRRPAEEAWLRQQTSEPQVRKWLGVLLCGRNFLRRSARADHMELWKLGICRA
jgi:hypothetical protein